MEQEILDNYSQVRSLCREYRVRRLDVFGSAIDPAAFDPSKSDVDLLVDFDPSRPALTLDEHFAFQAALAEIFGRAVDLVVASRLENPYLRADIKKTALALYAA